MRRVGMEREQQGCAISGSQATRKSPHSWWENSYNDLWSTSHHCRATRQIEVNVHLVPVSVCLSIGFFFITALWNPYGSYGLAAVLTATSPTCHLLLSLPSPPPPLLSLILLSCLLFPLPYAPSHSPPHHHSQLRPPTLYQLTASHAVSRSANRSWTKRSRFHHHGATTTQHAEGNQGARSWSSQRRNENEQYWQEKGRENSCAGTFQNAEKPSVSHVVMRFFSFCY